MVSQGIEDTEVPGAPTTAPPTVPSGDDVRQDVGFYALALRKLRRHRPAMVSVVVLLLISLAALVGPFLLPAAWDGPDLYHQFSPPGFPHLLGTDELGRDLLLRVLSGGRVSIMVGLLATVVTILAGVSVGTIAGYAGGWLDNVLMRFTDAMLAIPAIFLLILISTSFGQTPTVIILAIGFTAWPQTARIIRSVVLSVREKDYVEEARAIGHGHQLIVSRTVPPTPPSANEQCTTNDTAPHRGPADRGRRSRERKLR